MGLDWRQNAIGVERFHETTSRDVLIKGVTPMDWCPIRSLCVKYLSSEMKRKKGKTDLSNVATLEDLESKHEDEQKNRQTETVIRKDDLESFHEHYNHSRVHRVRPRVEQIPTRDNDR